MAKFKTIAEYNEWDEVDKAAHLQARLRGGAEQILWADGEREWTFEELAEKLCRRYGSQGQANQFRAELSARRRGRNETQ